MNNIDFIKAFICPNCQLSCNYKLLPELEGSIIDTSCPCKRSSISVYSHTNYYALYVNLNGPLQIQIHAYEDDNLTIFQLVEYPPHDKIMNVAGALHLVLNYIPNNLNWTNLQQLQRQLEILITFQ